MIGKLIYSVLAFTLTAFAGYYIALSNQISEFQSSFLYASYFVVIIFVFFMLLISFNKLPKSIISILNLSLTPFIFILLQFYYYNNLTLYDYLVMVAMAFISSITAAFTVIVVFGPAFTKKKETPKEILQYIPISIGQIIFALPGIGSIIIFSQYLINQYSWWILFVLILTMLQAGYSLCKNLKRASILD